MSERSLPENSTGPTLTVGDPKSGWCNGCTARPPYEPNETTQVRAKTTVMSYCPKCTLKLATDLTNHINERGFK